jgi:hypothetical protein
MTLRKYFIHMQSYDLFPEIHILEMIVSIFKASSLN